MQLKNSVYLNADRTKAFPEGHKDAFVLLAGPGQIVTADVAVQYNLTEDGAPGQSAQGSGILGASHLVNANSPDGVNTAPGTPPAMGLVGSLTLGTAAVPGGFKAAELAPAGGSTGTGSAAGTTTGAATDGTAAGVPGTATNGGPQTDSQAGTLDTGASGATAAAAAAAAAPAKGRPPGRPKATPASH